MGVVGVCAETSVMLATPSASSCSCSSGRTCRPPTVLAFPSKSGTTKIAEFKGSSESGDVAVGTRAPCSVTVKLMWDVGVVGERLLGDQEPFEAMV